MVNADMAGHLYGGMDVQTNEVQDPARKDSGNKGTNRFHSL